MSLVAVLLSICGALVIVSLVTAVCGVLACRRKRAPPPAGPAHWSTHVTVTPNCRARYLERLKGGFHAKTVIVLNNNSGITVFVKFKMNVLEIFLVIIIQQ